MERPSMGDADARHQPATSATPVAAPAGDCGDATDEPAHGDVRREHPEHLLRRPFTRADISELRHAVSKCAATAGLADQLLDDFVLAINELVTNAVRHGGGTGLLRLWRTGGELVCEVSDQGTGIDKHTATMQRRPPPSMVGGWGLWLARQLSSSMAVATGTTGTAIQISATLPTAGAAPPD